MITRDNFKNVLEELGFNGINDNYFSKIYDEGTEGEFKLVAKFENDKVLFEYPDGVRMNRSTTVDDHQKESYVVFDCVTRLFDIGYKPKNIVLEGLNYEGHDQGWIDVLVKDNDDVEYLIIECKTSDKNTKNDEFTKHWNKTEKNGDQLFRYFNTFRRSKYLCLYTADYDEILTNTYNLISLVDNDEYLKQNKLKGYKDVQNENGGASEYFAVWNKSYKLDYTTLGVFEKGIEPFKVGKRKWGIEDLILLDSSSMQKKYDEFARILRKYNVSSKENAFDKLVNLFIAKIIDEEFYKENDGLKCRWKGASYDDYFQLQDRLLTLYRDGMKKFFGDDVTYVENNRIDEAFKYWAEESKDLAKEHLQKIFRELKYFNNNPFAIMDVHNENLFYKNAVILTEIVKMIQDIKLKTNEQNQFLGDLFEGFLDQGIKQSEGQFFTPLPIVKFLISSLPLEKMICESNDIPKVIDYACGAGHFLTEVAEQIKKITENNKSDFSKYCENIYGIEKEYRLSKVSQVSAFMYGYNGIKIFNEDALKSEIKNEVSKGNFISIKDDDFSVLVANPPYSVKGFLETLDEDEDLEKKYELYDKNKSNLNIDTMNSIETFFVERASRLLKSDGVAAIILPSSVLSNGNIYIDCREIILKDFEIVAIFESGSGTFGKTGTNTITLFMRRRDKEMELKKQFLNRVDEWFGDNFESDGKYKKELDSDLLKKYCNHQNYNLDDYKKFCAGEICESLWKNDIFAEYKKFFESDTSAKKIKAKKIFSKYTEEDRKNDLKNYVYSQIKEIEKDKLTFFMLVCKNQKVLVIKSPNDNKEIKKFLGYEWSASKGNEGIKYLGTVVDDDENQIQKNKGIVGIQTPLFNPLDFDDTTKLNYYIKQNFLASSVISSATEKSVSLPDSLRKFASFVPLVDMLDFSRTTFDKAIKTQLKIDNGEMKIESKYPLVKLNEIAKISSGGTPDRKNGLYWNNGTIPWIKTGELKDNIIYDTEEKISELGLKESSAKLYKKDSLLVAMYGATIGQTAKLGIDATTNQACAVIYDLKENTINLNLLWEILKIYKSYFKSLAYGAAQPNINAKIVSELKIPLPPKDIQESIVSECEQIDKEYLDAQKKIEECKNEISAIMENVHNSDCDKKLISEIATSTEYGTAEKSLESGKVAVIRMGNIQDGKIDWNNLVYSNNEKDIEKLSLKKFDILFNRTNSPEHVGKVGIYMGEQPAIFAGYLIRINYKADEINPIYLCHILNSKKIRDYGFSIMSKSIHQANISGSALMKYIIPVPSLSDQQKIVEQITALEEEIADAKKTIAECSQRKEGVLKKWL